MSTGLLVVIIVVVVLIVVLLVLFSMRGRMAARRHERELERRRDEAAGEHREVAQAREQRADVAERKARIAAAEADRERAEAQIHEETARAHEQGLADDELTNEDGSLRDEDAGDRGATAGCGAMPPAATRRGAPPSRWTARRPSAGDWSAGIPIAIRPPTRRRHGEIDERANPPIWAMKGIRRSGLIAMTVTSANSTPAVDLEVGDRTVRISSPDRVYFSARGETKLDLARYYICVGDGIVRALRERPCMLHRFPKGVDDKKVHQKRIPKGAPAVGADGPGRLPVRPPRRRAVRDRARQRDLGGADGDRRVPPLELAPRRRRVPRRVADRPRSDARVRDRDGPASGRGRPRGARRARRRRVAEDVRWLGASHLRPDPAASGVSATSAGPRWRSPARWSAGRRLTRPRPGGARTGRSTRCSSITTRTPGTTRSPAPTRCAGSAGNGLDPGAVGRDRRRRAPGLHDRHRSGAIRPARGPARGHRRRGVRARSAAGMGGSG